MIAIFLSVIVLPIGGLVTRAEEGGAVRIERLSDGTRYAVIGETGNGPRPLLFVFHGDIDVAIREPIYLEVGFLLAKAGWHVAAIDAPAHGEDRRQGEPAGELAGWAARIEAGENLTAGFIARTRRVLDRLVAGGIADPARIAAVGTSRGGFLAFHFAAAEPRVRAVAGISPVTSLNDLREFRAASRSDAASEYDLGLLVSRLRGVPVWITIGNRDERVNTDAAIGLARRLVASMPPGEPAPVTLLVHERDGHRSSSDDHERLAAWLLSRTEFRR